MGLPLTLVSNRILSLDGPFGPGVWAGRAAGDCRVEAGEGQARGTIAAVDCHPGLKGSRFELRDLLRAYGALWQR